MPQIKGSMLRGALKFIKHSHHAGGIPAIVGALPPASAATFAKPIAAGDWYSYDAYCDLLRAIEREIGKGEPATMPHLGRFAARHDLSGVFKVISVLAGIPRILQSASVFWSRYHDTGRFEVVDMQADHGTGQIYEFPQMVREHEAMLTGWIEGIGLAAGARSVDVRLVRSIHRGDAWSEYSMRWTS